MVKPGEKPYMTDIMYDLKSMQAAVGGLLKVFLLDNGAVLVCNKDSENNGLPDSRQMDNGDIVAGKFFIAGDGGWGKFTHLSLMSAEEYMGHFEKIEQFMPKQRKGTLFTRFSEK